MKRNFLEIACFNAESAAIAQSAGADRIELCDDLAAGGITPGILTIEQVRTEAEIPLFIMIRPRGGDFVYTEKEFEQMKQEIAFIKRMGVDGFVFGILNEDGTVDKQRNLELVRLADPLSCTFHRAFDRVPDPFKAMEDVIACGFRTILTSGKAAAASEGMPLLSCLVQDAKNRITIMPGGGVRSSSIAALKQATNALFYHSSAITDKSGIADQKEIKLMKEKLR
ncbi:MAG: cutC [Bacteroidetes bacterium]|nr:cutC [Bacteroidota bacterium]